MARMQTNAEPSPSPMTPSLPARLAIGAVVTVVFGLFVLWWTDGRGRHRVFPKRFHVVEPGRIYRSGQIDRSLIEPMLKQYGIGMVIDLDNYNPDSEDEIHELEVVERLGLDRVAASTLDGRGVGDVHEYATALEAMAAAVAQGTPVLVHCGAGTERTGAAIAWYRMLLQGWDGRRAYGEMMSFRRPKDRPDPLLRYVNEHTAELARLLLERGVIERVPDPLPVLPGRPIDHDDER